MEILTITEWLSDHMLTCPLKAMTGIDCPGCGMQRAVIKLLEGDIEGSIAMNPTVIPFMFLMIFLLLHLKFQFKHGARILTYLYIASAVILVVNYIFKWINGTVFS